MVESELRLLRRNGHDVECLFRHNDDVPTTPVVSLALQTLWSRSSSGSLTRLATEFRPDLIHVHNTFPLISASLYWAAAEARIPVVQTLHNFRLFCLQAMLLRNGAICEDCLGKLPWRGVVRGCYRGSRLQSGVLAGMLTLHRALSTYRTKVTRYIALNEFCRRKFVEGGLPEHKVVIKPNFVDDPGIRASARQGFLFVGRLSAEKGISVLAEAARRCNVISVRIAGTGPESDRITEVPGLIALGALSGDRVMQEMAGAMALVMPSIWYESFPRTLVEAFACALPVIASRLGAMAELIEDGKTGLLFETGNAADLAHKMDWASANPGAMREMGANARREYEAKYTPEINYRQLMAIYADAIAAMGRQTSSST